MPAHCLSYIDINEIIRDIKSSNKFKTEEEVTEIILKNISEGFVFEGKTIKAVAREFFNPLASKKSNWYHFLCPKCGKKAKKLYIQNNREVQCRECSKIRNKSKVNTQADRIIQIQKYINEIFNNKKLSEKQKSRMMQYIVKHYQSLDDKYKMAYNTFVLKNLQNWCMDTILNESLSKDYRLAIKDVLRILKDSKKVLSRTALIKK